MKKYRILNKLLSSGLVAVIRAENAESAQKVIDAVKKGGITNIEITMTVPFAADIIKALTAENTELLIGAGTVLDAETARYCMLAGASYIVSPSFDSGTAFICNRYSVPYIPGIATPAEAVTALEHGCDILKIFPADIFGLKIIRTLKGPFPNAQFMPTGGISLENAENWLREGAAVIGIGGCLTEGAKNGDYERITKTAEAFVRAASTVRKECLK